MNKLIEHTEDTFKKCLNIMKAKNKDYGGDKDPLFNFRLIEHLGICSVETGILVRMCDKIARIPQVINGDNAVKDEKIEDTLEDLINYSSILLFAIKEKNGKNTKS